MSLTTFENVGLYDVNDLTRNTPTGSALRNLYDNRRLLLVSQAAAAAGCCCCLPLPCCVGKLVISRSFLTRRLIL